MKREKTIMEIVEDLIELSDKMVKDAKEMESKLGPPNLLCGSIMTDEELSKWGRDDD